jgi:hypothetical protein
LFPRRSGTSTSIIANQGDGGDEQQQQQQQDETAIEIKGLDDDNHQDTTVEEGIISPSNSNESVTDALKLKQ